MMVLIVEVLDARDSTPRENELVYVTFDWLIGVSQQKCRTDRRGLARFEFSHRSAGDQGQISVRGDDVYEGPLENETKTFFVR